MSELFGKLDIRAFQHDAIENSVGVVIALTSIVLISFVTYKGLWRPFWKNWITSLDPKRIGVMYLIVVLLMLFKGVMDAAMMRAHLAMAVGDASGFLETSHFQQVFSAHGTTMIFFVGMGTIFATMNFVVPLQIGARDVAFPFLNSVSFWLFAVSAALVNVSMFVGEFSATGWTAYPPLSGIEYSPGVGVDYWIWILQISGVGSLLGGINFLVTILRMRAPGMTLMRMPIFIWSVLCTTVLIVFVFPILTATLSLLALDRIMGMHFFTPEAGGNPMMYINLFWAWGHPEVYILILPAFGMFSEVVATFSQKKLFGYTSMVWALIFITFLSFVVWLHHFFTMGSGASVNAFFGIMTVLIAVPTGVKVFNWLFTMRQGKIHLSTPMLWFLSFIFIFTTGGMTGVLMSIPPADFQVHNSLFLIAHFHSMVIGGVLFGFFAGLSYWFPKFTGFKFDERLGRYAFWCWFIGFLLAFMPLYALGLMGATRRLDHYSADTGWHPLYMIALTGVPFIIVGIILQNLQIYVGYKNREKDKKVMGDSWNGRTLEWSTSSPPPEYNFAIVPTVGERDPFWATKEGDLIPVDKNYHDILMPKNTSMGFWMAGFAFLMGFGIIWHIWWFAILNLLIVIGCLIYQTWGDIKEKVITAAEVASIEQKGVNRWQN